MVNVGTMAEHALRSAAELGFQYMLFLGTGKPLIGSLLHRSAMTAHLKRWSLGLPCRRYLRASVAIVCWFSHTPAHL